MKNSVHDTITVYSLRFVVGEIHETIVESEVEAGAPVLITYQLSIRHGNHIVHKYHACLLGTPDITVKPFTFGTVNNMVSQMFKGIISQIFMVVLD
jgi:hypothetical protein